MERSQIPVLESLNIRPRPLGSHSLSWSSDGELAVASEDCIHVYLPSYPSPRRPGDGGPPSSVGVPPPQFSLTIRISSKIKASKELNRQLFVSSGVKIPSRDVPDGFGGSGPVTGRGAAMSQVVRAEWSPSGLGCNLRPVLLALLTNGCLVAFGEHVDEKEAAASGLRSRTVKMWKILWGLGAMLPIPDPEEIKGHRFMDERITSFSWARVISPGTALLAYRTEAGDVAIMSVQYGSKPSIPEVNSLKEGWTIQELARFNGSGPHEELDDAVEPDFVPSGTSFALKWSQWVADGETRTATLAYIGQNYVGFRRITVTGGLRSGEQPRVAVEVSDTTSTCLFLASDAFVDFEDAVWTKENRSWARGYIGTPSELKPFEIPLTGSIEPPLEQHSTTECGTTYPEVDGPSNPIVGIAMHPADPENKPPLPLYTAVRLSATGTNQDWYETNLPTETSKFPSWAERIRKNTTTLVSRATVMGGLDHESDSDDVDDGLDSEERPEAMEHPYRFRIWGLAASPGGSSTAVVVSKYSSLYPHRQGKCNVYFGREPLARPRDATKLTTEGKMWEWMHAEGPSVPGVTVFDRIKTEGAAGSESGLRALFRDVLSKQLCVFCDGTLTTVGDSAWCENGHAWSACVSTGLAIMKPGVSHVCAVCGMRCLRRSELQALANEHLGQDVSVPEATKACEACGGKFVI